MLREGKLAPGSVGNTKSNNVTQASRLTVNGWLKEIGDAVGKDISLNTTGICSFTYEKHTMTIEVTNHSVFLYSNFDVKHFDIDHDSYKALLTDIKKDISPIFYFAMDVNVSPSAFEGDVQSNDLVAGVTRRVEEMDSQSFSNLLESFIDIVLNAGKRLDMCVAKRYLRTKLSHNKRSNSTHSFSVLEKLSSYFRQLIMKAAETKQVDFIMNNIDMVNQTMFLIVRLVTKITVKYGSDNNIRRFFLNVFTFHIN